MKKVTFTLVAAFALVLLITSCTDSTTADNELQEESSIRNSEISDDEI